MTWVESYSEQVAATYSYNSATNETRWSAPPAETASAAGGAVTDDSRREASLDSETHETSRTTVEEPAAEAAAAEAEAAPETEAAPGTEAASTEAGAGEEPRASAAAANETRERSVDEADRPHCAERNLERAMRRLQDAAVDPAPALDPALEPEPAPTATAVDPVAAEAALPPPPDAASPSEDTWLPKVDEASGQTFFVGSRARRPTWSDRGRDRGWERVPAPTAADETCEASWPAVTPRANAPPSWPVVTPITPPACAAAARKHRSSWISSGEPPSAVFAEASQALLPLCNALPQSSSDADERCADETRQTETRPDTLGPTTDTHEGCADERCSSSCDDHSPAATHAPLVLPPPQSQQSSQSPRASRSRVVALACVGLVLVFLALALQRRAVDVSSARLAPGPAGRLAACAAPLRRLTASVRQALASATGLTVADVVARVLRCEASEIDAFFDTMRRAEKHQEQILVAEELEPEFALYVPEPPPITPALDDTPPSLRPMLVPSLSRAEASAFVAITLLATTHFWRRRVR